MPPIIYIFCIKNSDDRDLLSYNVISHSLNNQTVASDPNTGTSPAVHLYGRYSMAVDASSGNLVISATGYNYLQQYPVDEGYLWYYDIKADPSSPVFKKTKDIGIRVESLIIENDFAYCSTYNGYVVIIGLSSSGLIKRSEIIARGNGLDIDIHKGSHRLLVASGTSAASLIAFQESEDINYGSTVGLSFGGIGNNNVFYDGQFLYTPVGGSPGYLKSYTMSTDGNVSLYSQCELDVKNVLVRGNYVFAGYKGLSIGKMSEAGKLDNLSVNTIQLMNDVNNLEIWGDYLYVSEGNMGVEIFDISTPEFPQSVGWVNSFSDARMIIVRDDKLYFIDSGYGLCCYDVADPVNPVYLGDFCDTNSNKSGSGLTSSGDYIYYLTSTGLYILSGNNVTSWQNADSGSSILGSALYYLDNSETALYGLNAQGRVLYTSVYVGSPHLAAFDIEQPTKPKLFFTDYDRGISYSYTEVFGNAVFYYMEHNFLPVYIH